MQTTTDTSMPEVEISVRQTERLSATAKGHAEETVVAYIARAFDRLNLRYTIRWDYPPVPDVPDPADGKLDALEYWSDRINSGELDGISKDSNLLLTSLNGGGIAYPGAKGAITPAGTLTEDYSTDLRDCVAPDDPRSPIYGTLHELAHNLGSRHSANWGRTWVDDGTQVWYRTACANGGTINLAGEKQVEQPDGYEKRNCLYYADHAATYMDIK